MRSCRRESSKDATTAKGRADIAASCYSLSGMYRAMKEEALATQRLQQACDMSVRAMTAHAAFFRAGGGMQSETASPFCGQSAP